MEHFQEFKSVFQKLNPAAKIDEEAEEFLREAYEDLQSKADSLVPENKDGTKEFRDILMDELFYYDGKRFMKTGPEKAVRWNPGAAAGNREEDARPARRKMNLEPKAFQKEDVVKVWNSA